MGIDIMTTIAQVDHLLQKGIKKDFERSKEYAVLLGDIHRIAETSPEALTDLQNKYMGKYLALHVKRGSKYAA